MYGACAPADGRPRASASPPRPMPSSAHAPVRRGDADVAPGFRRSRILRPHLPSHHRSPSRPAARCPRSLPCRPARPPSFCRRRCPTHPMSRRRGTTRPCLGRRGDGPPNSTSCRRSEPSRPARPLPAANRGRPPAVRRSRRSPHRSPPLRKRPLPFDPSRHALGHRDAGGAGPGSCRCRSRGRSSPQPPHRFACRSSSREPRRHRGERAVGASNPWRVAGWSRLAVARAPGLLPRAPAALRRARGSPHPAGRPAAALQVRTRGLRSRRLASHLSPSPSRPGGRALDEQVLRPSIPTAGPTPSFPRGSGTR